MFLCSEGERYKSNNNELSVVCVGPIKHSLVFFLLITWAEHDRIQIFPVHIQLLKQCLDRFLIITECQPTIKFYLCDIYSGLDFVFVLDIYSLGRFNKIMHIPWTFTSIFSFLATESQSLAAIPILQSRFTLTSPPP